MSVTVIRVGRSSGSGTHWWRGEGPPPVLIVGARIGDFYWDTISGNVYELTAG